MRDAAALVRPGPGVREIDQRPAPAPRANGKTAPPLQTSTSTWPAGLDLEDLAAREPQKPSFIVADWCPTGYATLLAGHGGVGKSGIALQLAVCIAAGMAFWGIEVQRRRVLYLSCEDRENVLHWRLARIAAHLAIDLAELRGMLEIVDLVGRDTILWERDPKTGHAYTAAFGELAERVREAEAEVLIVDGISDTFGGNENARTEVKRYVNALVSLVPADRGAVVLVGHVPKPKGGIESEGYSGSTAWHNSVRARWYLSPETTEGEDGGRAERTGALVLELKKSNLGRTDRELRFRWDDDAHLFVGESSGMSTFDRKHQERTELDGIVAAMRAVIAKGDYIPAATTGRRTAHHVLAACPEFPAALKNGKPGTRRFWRLIEQLRAMSIVRESSIRRTTDRHGVRTLVLSEGRGESGNA